MLGIVLVDFLRILIFPEIRLIKTVKRKINKYAFSGGQVTLEEHRKKGGNPEVDVSFQYLRMFFEESDEF